MVACFMWIKVSSISIVRKLKERKVVPLWKDVIEVLGSKWHGFKWLLVRWTLPVGAHAHFLLFVHMENLIFRKVKWLLQREPWSNCFNKDFLVNQSSA